MQYGCHVSLGKGLLDAAKRAKDLGADTFQIFSKNPKSLREKKIDIEDAKKGREFCQTNNLTLILHTPYITNLSTPKEDLHELTVRSLIEDLHIAEAYGAIGAVVHCGKHVEMGEEYGLNKMIETLDEILENYNGSAKLLLENTAGQGSELGLAPETLMYIRNSTKYPEKIGFCFDTCHAFAAGEWNEGSFNNFIERAEQTGYLANIACIHFNDSKAPFNSRKDRHAKIGKGEIGSEALAKFLHCEKLQHIPFILETPVDDEEEYRDEIEYIKTI